MKFLLPTLSRQRDGTSKNPDDEGPSTKNNNGGHENSNKNNDSRHQEKDPSSFLKQTVQLQDARSKRPLLPPTQVSQQQESINDKLLLRFAHYNNLNLGPVQRNIVDNEFQVGPFVVESFLAKGSFAAVFLGTHSQSYSSYALKRIKKKRNLSQGDLNNLAREIKVAQVIHHPNVVQCHEVIHTPRNIYLVMDLGYRDLFDYFGKDVGGPVPIQVLREVTLGLIKGVEYLHSVGIAHLDIKPENVLISRNVKPWELTSNDIMLCDFGLCEIAPEDNRTGAIRVGYCRGTPGFVCPEMIMNRGCEGRQADMWSVGVTLLDMAGQVPQGWMELQKSKSFERRLRGMLEMIRYRHHFVDANVYDLVNNLLRWRPEDRLTAKRALQHPWFCDGSSSYARRSVSVDVNHMATWGGGWFVA